MTESLRDLIREQQVWGSDDSIAFFSRERSRFEDLYSSERIFLPAIAGRVSTILDVGCACGGFAGILQTINSAAAYTGVDILPDMVARAAAAHPDARFVGAAAHSLPFAGQSFDLVHCSGSVHLNSQYPRMISELWRVARQYALFDMRLTNGPSETGGFTVNFSGDKDGGRLPYHVVNLAEARAVIDGLPNPPARVHLAGYHHPPSANADLPGDASVIMAFLLLERDGEKSEWEINIKKSVE